MAVFEGLITVTSDGIMPIISSKLRTLFAPDHHRHHAAGVIVPT
ncbi:hypothetical protein [Mesorhizobium sp. BH1-1-4]|nr:hypothetical protein [Mesorhizobium sp. BH1-1-4]